MFYVAFKGVLVLLFLFPGFTPPPAVEKGVNEAIVYALSMFFKLCYISIKYSTSIRKKSTLNFLKAVPQLRTLADIFCPYLVLNIVRNLSGAVW